MRCYFLTFLGVLVVIALGQGYSSLRTTRNSSIMGAPCACDNQEKSLCFGLPSVCLLEDASDDCIMLVQIKQSADISLTGLQVNLCSNQIKEGWWYGFALSEDANMGDDFLVHCDILQNGSLSMGEGMTSGHSNVVSLPPETLTLSKLEKSDSPVSTNVTINDPSVTLTENRLECSWNQKIVGEVRGRAFNLKLIRYHLLLANGRLTKEGSLDYHTGGRSASPNTVDLLETGLITASPMPVSWWVRFHAFFMIFAWMMIISISITMARNYRDAWTYVKFFDLHIWLFTHKIINIGAAIFVAIGMTCIMIHVGTFRFVSCHAIAGTIANSLMILQIIAGLARPSDERTILRKIFKIFHGLGGHITFIAACVALYKAADQSSYIRLGITYKGLIVLFIVIHYLTQVILQSSQMLIKSLNAVRDISSTSFTPSGRLTPSTQTPTKGSVANSTTMLYDYVQDKIDRFKFNALLYYIPSIFLLTIITYTVAMINAESYN